ncbi:phage tail protein [Herbaspirillum chlorophenolicum]|uniref:phage tail protein n=1 Tax=Herbaspirillum chlorophenolicum TaxID=211589 RepID=UPI00067D6953|nr:phage tail protein [Herbaspirillum chlorophenolicum]
MSISFSEVPDALRYPGAYIEIDGSQAGLGSGLPTVLLVGQKLPTGTAPAGELIRLSGVKDAQLKAGEGSMLAQMAAAYRKADQTFDLYMLPYADNAAGVAAHGTITVNAPATDAGTLALYIAGRPIMVGINSTQDEAMAATAIAAAITAAGMDIPVIATVEDAVVTLTARHKGTCGNAIDIRLNLFGEEVPADLGLSITAMTGGTGDPIAGDLVAMTGKLIYNYAGLGINDAATLAAWHAETQRRRRVPMQAGFRAFTAHRGDFDAAASFGESKNYEHIADLSLELNPPTTWEAAATLVSVAAPSLNNNPVKSLEGLQLPGLKAVTYHDWTNSNSLLFKGMSVMEVGKDGSCSIKRLISMYLYRPDGATDDAYLDINASEVTERIRTEQRNAAIQRFRGTVAAKTNEGFRPGLPITTEDSVRALLLSVYKNVLMAEKGWVQAYDYYKSTLLVEQDATNPSRFNFQDDPVINSPFYIVAGHSRFRKAVPLF